MNVQKFKPQELNVKVVGDYAVIEGKHEERLDKDCLISRQFTRRYKLPKDIDAKALESKLSSDGVLQLHAPKLVSNVVLIVCENLCSIFLSGISSKIPSYPLS